MLFPALVCLCCLSLSQAFFVDVKKFVSDGADKLNEMIFRNPCYGDLGCFYTGPPFYHPIWRPIPFAPDDPKDMKTKFWLFTPDNKKTRYQLEPNADSIKNSSFNVKYPTKCIIHGFISTLEEGDARHRMRNAFFDKGNFNIIIVDWTNSNGLPYSQAVANTRVVGAQLAQLIKALEEHAKLDPKSVHLIGHSLGAHIAGYAGERIDGLSRITGVDPAGPYFYYQPKQVRLDPTDAKFVDAIHTNAGNIGIDGLGIIETVGHQDFYPNGGEHQPGCKPTLFNETVLGIDITAVGSGEGLTSFMATSCDHNEGNEYYIVSIGSKNCTFIGKECDDAETYGNGKCSDGLSAVMGYYAKKQDDVPAGNKYYLKTSGETPFCIPESQSSQ